MKIYPKRLIPTFLVLLSSAASLATINYNKISTIHGVAPQNIVNHSQQNVRKVTKYTSGNSKPNGGLFQQIKDEIAHTNESVELKASDTDKHGFNYIVNYASYSDYGILKNNRIATVNGGSNGNNGISSNVSVGVDKVSAITVAISNTDPKKFYELKMTNNEQPNPALMDMSSFRYQIAASGGVSSATLVFNEVYKLRSSDTKDVTKQLGTFDVKNLKSNTLHFIFGTTLGNLIITTAFFIFLIGTKPLLSRIWTKVSSKIFGQTVEKEILSKATQAVGDKVVANLLTKDIDETAINGLKISETAASGNAVEEVAEQSATAVPKASNTLLTDAEVHPIQNSEAISEASLVPDNPSVVPSDPAASVSPTQEITDITAFPKAQIKELVGETGSAAEYKVATNIATKVETLGSDSIQSANKIEEVAGKTEQTASKTEQSASKTTEGTEKSENIKKSQLPRRKRFVKGLLKINKKISMGLKIMVSMWAASVVAIVFGRLATGTST